MGVIILILVLVLLCGSFPQVGIHRWGYGPSGLFAVILIICVVLLLTGRL